MSPFRSNYLRYEELTRIVHDWASAHPEFRPGEEHRQEPRGARVLAARRSAAIPIGARAAAWVDGNMHATEVCGSSVALAIAEDVIRASPRAGRPCSICRAHVADAPARRALLRAAAHVARRRRGACSRPAATCARTRATRASSAADAALDARRRRRRRPSRSRCASTDPAGDFVESTEHPRPACSRARSRTRARSTRSTPRARSRTSTASRPRRRIYLSDNDDRSQPQLPVRLGARARAGRRRRVRRERARVARGRRVRDARTRTSSRG